MAGNYASYSEKAKAAHKRLTKANTLRHIARNQEFVLLVLSVCSCVDCGEADPVVLDFDHVRGSKVKPVAYMIRRGFALATLVAELEKCEVRCANCHRRKTAKQLGWYRYGELVPARVRRTRPKVTAFPLPPKQR